MLKLYRKFRPIDWILTLVIIGLTVLQVFLMMQMIDYTQNITETMQYLAYQSHPESLDNILSDQMIELIKNSGWDGLLSQYGSMIPTDIKPIIESIADASANDIWYNGGIMLAYAAGSIGCQVVICVIAAYISSCMATSIRKDVNDKISRFSLAELNKFNTSSLVTRATNDIQNVQMTNLLIMRMIFTAPVMIIWSILKMQSTHWSLMLSTVVAVVILISVLSVTMVFAIPKFKSMQTLTDRLNRITQENLSGIRVIRAYNAEEYQEKKFAVANNNLTKTQLFTGRLTGILSPLMSIVMSGLTLAIYWIGAYLINGNTMVDGKPLNFGSIMSFSMLGTQIIMSFLMLLMMFILLPRAEVCAKRINEVLETKDSIVDPTVENLPDPNLKGKIEFRDVSFKYPDAETNFIEHISFRATAGQTIAFIGATGSGKSTIVNLITRLYDTTSGQVLIDGVDVRNLKQKTLRSKIGFVPQKGLLFSGTVASNIAFGKPDLFLKKIEEAAQIACADEFIEKMDGQYDAPIARGGTNVSGGQRQRLCIARAVAIDPEFLVFDDSFSALDYRTDKKVRDNLKEKESATTKIIVAQRIGTIMDADQILVIADGKVVGQGTHRELLQNCEAYREIALSQLTKEELGI